MCMCVCESIYGVHSVCVCVCVCVCTHKYVECSKKLCCIRKVMV